MHNENTEVKEPKEKASAINLTDKKIAKIIKKASVKTTKKQSLLERIMGGIYFVLFYPLIKLYRFMSPKIQLIERFDSLEDIFRRHSWEVEQIYRTASKEPFLQTRWRMRNTYKRLRRNIKYFYINEASEFDTNPDLPIEIKQHKEEIALEILQEEHNLKMKIESDETNDKRIKHELDMKIKADLNKLSQQDNQATKGQQTANSGTMTDNNTKITDIEHQKEGNMQQKFNLENSKNITKNSTMKNSQTDDDGMITVETLQRDKQAN